MRPLFEPAGDDIAVVATEIADGVHQPDHDAEVGGGDRFADVRPKRRETGERTGNGETEEREREPDTEGVGKVPKQGDFVKIRYIGKLLGGKIFDKSPVDEPYIDDNLMAGWAEGLTFFNEGAEGYLLIPSKLGLAAMPLEENRKVVVPPNSVLIYKIQIIGIK